MTYTYKLSESQSDRINFDAHVARIAREWFEALPEDREMIATLNPRESADFTPCGLASDDPEEAQARWVDVFARTVAQCKRDWLAGNADND